MSEYEPDKYLPTIDAILSVANLEEITVKKIRKALQELFGVDLNEHKKEINEVILNRYYNLQRSREEESEAAKDRDREEMERQDALLAAKLSRQETVRQPRAKRRLTKTSTSTSTSSTKEKTRRAPNNAFNREMALSHELQDVIAQEKCSRPQVVKHLWAYIKANNLQNPNDKRQIMCDDKLQKLFKKKTVGSFEMNRILSKHIYVPDDNDYTSSSQVQDDLAVDNDDNEGDDEDTSLEKTTTQVEEASEEE
ncbi:hypothetical protein KGF57_000608 [Candida theae]|uniref:DM2 domain-containing protein n=1 Tax=Candida theae TaxID=1198502 RepID=A0AAD5BJ61_9ASCO|nr:uncharacterized protein KGF57_000608 [Candida theae]KAI5966644.1 hypothetical protein KGF57_000608 [Candida theae]